MPQPLVSISIITYNQIDFIHETLTGALNQSYENLEVVVADDGSTDGTAEVILEFAKQNPGRLVPLVGGPNLGITGNSNRALSACKGKYIAIMGGDDVFLPGKIIKQVNWLEEDERRVLCAHHIEVFYENGRPPHLHKKHLTSGSGPQKFIRHGLPFGASSVMVRARSAPKRGFDPALKWVSDGLYFTETLMGGGVYGYVPGIYARCRKHDNNITSQWEMCVKDLSNFYEIIRERYPQYRKDADIGEANVIIYGYGLGRLKMGEAKRAISQFWKGIRRNPLGYKLWVRLIQAVFALPSSAKAKRK